MARNGKRIIHNDTGTPDKHTCRRIGCGHIRSKHKEKCMALHYDPFGPTVACACTEFVEAPTPAPSAKPLPDMMTMRLRWTGEAPKVGEWLMGQGATARLAYKIISVRETKSDVRTFELQALKVPKAELPPGAFVHPLTWDTRNPSKGRTHAQNGEAIKQGAGWGRE